MKKIFAAIIILMLAGVSYAFAAQATQPEQAYLVTQPPGATRFYTPNELHLAQVYRIPVERLVEAPGGPGDAGASSAAASPGD